MIILEGGPYDGKELDAHDLPPGEVTIDYLEFHPELGRAYRYVRSARTAPDGRPIFTFKPGKTQAAS